jgi:hypothetical protein
MRFLAPLLIATALGSCSAGPPTAMAPTPQQQAKFASLTAGKVAGAPMSCLSSHRSADMIVIDDSTIAFRDGSKRVYVNHMQGECANLGRGGQALVTQNPTGQLCRGDIAQVLDVTSRIPMGSCVFGDFVPYTRPGA